MGPLRAMMLPTVMVLASGSNPLTAAGSPPFPPPELLLLVLAPHADTANAVHRSRAGIGRARLRGRRFMRGPLGGRFGRDARPGRTYGGGRRFGGGWPPAPWARPTGTRRSGRRRGSGSG